MNMSTASIPSSRYRPVDLVSLMRAEFREMPGLSVTLAQAARLWNADRGQCADALEALRREGFLHRSHEMYLRVTCGRRGA
jgi:hypothetical protein